MDKRNLYIIVAVILIGVAVLIASNYTGQIIRFGKCVDSDGGDDPWTPGVASYEKNDLKYKDECYSTSAFSERDYLREKICLETISTKRYYCENGCLENANGEGYCAEGRANAK